MGRPYAYGTYVILAHTRTGYPIRIWDVPYAYGSIYAYGAEQLHDKLLIENERISEDGGFYS